MRIHGNWCGGGWSDGRVSNSVFGFAPAISEFDETCRQHDFGYARGTQEDADRTFFEENVGRGGVRTAAAFAVYGYNTVRRSLDNDPGAMSAPPEKMVKVPTAMRGASGPPMANRRALKRQKLNAKSSKPNKTRKVSANVADGTIIRSGQPAITRKADCLTVRGTEFVGSVTSFNQANFEVGMLFPLHPSFMPGSNLSNFIRSFSRYKWKYLRFNFITSVPTSEQGSVLLSTNRHVLSPAYNTATAGFLASALATGRGLLTPIWQSASVVIDVDDEYRLVDFAISSDVDQQVDGELVVYTQSATSGTCGYVTVDYEVELCDPQYAIHQGWVPVNATNIGYGTYTDSANNTGNNTMTLVYTSGTTFTGPNNGAVFKMILNLDLSTIAAGATSSNVLSAVNAAPTSTSTVSSTTQSLTLGNGSVLYGLLNGSNLIVFMNLESAMNCYEDGSVVYGQTVSAKSIWAFWIYPLHMGRRSVFIQTST